MTEEKKGYIELDHMGGSRSPPNPYGSLRATASNNRKSRMFNSPAVGIATFLYAAAQNEVELVQGLLDEESVKVNDCDYDKRTALHVAACEGHTEVVRILLAEGADVNFADRYNSTPLDDAIHHGHQEVAKMLIERGAKHGAGANFGMDLVYAAGQGDLRTVQRLVENHIPIQSTDFDNRTPLHVAIAGRHYEVVKFLLEHGADLTVEDRFGGTPLEEAHRAGVRLGEDPILNLVMHHAGKEIERKSWRTSLRNPFFFTFLAVELAIGILFAIFSKYGLGATAGEPLDQGLATITQRHPFFMDVHVMIFIGFGFLMTFLRKYGYTAVGLTFVLGSLSIQVYQLSATFWENVISNGDNWKEVEITVFTLIKGDFAAGAVLISFGALLGKVTFTQMLLLSVFEVFFYSLNEAISLKMEVADIGGSMVIHMFGAFFGLAASFVLTPKSARGNRDNSAVYHSDIFSMIGTVFLWIYWPSFNGALSEGNAQHRAVINTVLSLTASCVFAFMFSQFWRREKVFNMVDIQNATLAGGVAMGSSADMALHPSIALLVGAVAGTVSVFGFAILQGIVENTLRVHDTCGVLNLHGMPGLIGGFVSVIVTAAFGIGSDYSVDQQDFIYPGRGPPHNRSATQQAKIQLAFIFITLGISIGTALFSSFILSKLPYPKKFFLDSTSFETPGREVPYFFDKRGEARHSSDKASERPSAPLMASPDMGGAPSGGGGIDAKNLAEVQNKITALETALRSQRRILREQAKAFEETTGVRVAGVLSESVSSMNLPKFPVGGPGPSPLRPQPSVDLGMSGPSSRAHAESSAGGGLMDSTYISQPKAPAGTYPSQANLATILENLSRQVGMLVENQKQQQQQQQAKKE